MKASWRALTLIAAVAAVPADMAARTTGAPWARSSPSGAIVKHLQFANSRLVVSFAPAEFQLPEQEIVDWVLRSARATATFFGRFPVAQVHIALDATSGDDVTEGVAHASPDARIRVTIGRRTTAATLKRDSTMVHEMTHLGFPDLDDSHLWLHEGIATYVEVVARAQALEISPAAAWAHFVREMPQGLPERGDQGLDQTPSEDRRYWGGAMFCLMADVEIRRRTANRFGLKDALRGILEAGGTLANTWQVERALSVGDRAVGVPVLQELFATWQSNPVAPDLDAMWAQLGVRKTERGVGLVDTTPMAPIRRAITDMPARPLLLVAPSLVRESTRR
jgi:hypothetical protein